MRTIATVSVFLLMGLVAGRGEARIDRSRALVFSGLGCFGVGVAGFVVGKGYAADADSSYVEYLRDDVSSQEEIDALRSRTEDLDLRAAVWRNVGVGGIAAGTGLVLASVFVGRTTESSRVSRYSLDLAAAPRGGRLRLAMHF
jgi:hypothetical protein